MARRNVTSDTNDCEVFCHAFSLLKNLRSWSLNDVRRIRAKVQRLRRHKEHRNRILSVIKSHPQTFALFSGSTRRRLSATTQPGRSTAESQARKGHHLPQ